MNGFKQNIFKKLKPYSSYIPEINKATMRSHLKLCVAFLEHHKYSKEAFDKEVTKLTAAYPDGPQDHEIYCTIVMILLEIFLQNKKQADDLSKVLRELKFQEECIEDLTKVLTSNHQNLSEQLQEMKLVKPLENFQYRINISLLESGQQPTIILHQKNGDNTTVNLSLKEFHRLRLAIASSLAEVQALETKRN